MQSICIRNVISLFIIVKMKDSILLSSISNITLYVTFCNVVFCLSVRFLTTERPAVQTDGRYIRIVN